jgi:hypothetical protein
MRSVSGRRILRIIPCLALCAAAAANPHGRSLPAKWDIQIIVEAEGRYSLEGGDERHEGSFALRSHWLGLMERDDEDFLLLHKECTLEKWDAEERALRGEALEVLKTSDFGARPELRINYVMGHGQALLVDFAVQGFVVPRAPADEVFPLLLPASAGSGMGAPGRPYDLNIRKGSNRIELPLSAILKGPEVRKYAWTWSDRDWMPGPARNLLATQSHQAVVTVSITPHEE